MNFKVGDRVRYKEDGSLGFIDFINKDDAGRGTYWIQWDDNRQLMWSFADEIEMVEENKSQSEEVKTEKVKSMISLKQNREALKRLSDDIEELDDCDSYIAKLQQSIEEHRRKREEIANRIRALGISVD